MDTILQQKRKGQAQFRIQIDNFLANSLFTKQGDQLSLDVIQQLFAVNPKDGLYTNGKISLQKLMESIYDSGSHFSTKQFSKIFNNKKELRPQQIFQVLKNHDLTQFDLQEEIMKNFFQNDKLSVKKLDKTMKELGYNELNKKDKQIMIQCFDYNRDNMLTAKDLQQMLDKAVQNRQDKKNKSKDKNQKNEFQIHEKNENGKISQLIKQ